MVLPYFFPRYLRLAADCDATSSFSPAVAQFNGFETSIGSPPLLFSPRALRDAHPSIFASCLSCLTPSRRSGSMPPFMFLSGFLFCYPSSPPCLFLPPPRSGNLSEGDLSFTPPLQSSGSPATNPYLESVSLIPHLFFSARLLLFRLAPRLKFWSDVSPPPFLAMIVDPRL